ncbi:35521_t:CDS:2 [Gigaspora margarita]|uniref:35521_t:CDS:1 n=1 Tax=Gigaspora margarita TaxID=4874 RepID=A0ABN7VQK9_GIGMA|nr:35521_t:CDS:2 [Gigaspora margarita]
MKDVVVVNKLFAKVHDLRNGIHVGFEIKKKFQDSHIHQAIGKLIIANIVSQFLDNLQGNLQYENEEEDGPEQLLNSPKVNFKFDNNIANMNNMLEITTKEKMLH